MSAPRTDVIAIGNAIVDVMAPCEDGLIDALGLVRGGMTLIDTERAHALYDAMGPAREISGGSAANTLAGLAALGARCAFIGQVAEDQLGEVFAHDIRAGGIEFATPARPGDPPTARCLIFVTSDGQRTMNTFLGASQFLPPEALDEAAIRDAKILYLEGYLWDPEEPRAAMRRAIAAAKEAGRKVAFTLSDAFVIERHGADFRAMIETGEIDILFANHVELAALTGHDDFDRGLAELAQSLCRRLPKFRILAAHDRHERPRRTLVAQQPERVHRRSADVLALVGGGNPDKRHHAARIAGLADLLRGVKTGPLVL